MPGAIAVKLNQTTAAVGLLLAGLMFGCGYITGKLAVERACQSQISITQQQLAKMTEFSMRVFHESRNGPLQAPSEPADTQPPLESFLATRNAAARSQPLAGEE